MGNDITAGYTYDTGASKEVTAANLNQHVNDAVLKYTAISARSAKATPADADEILLHDASTNTLKKASFAQAATAPAFLGLAAVIPPGLISPFGGASAPSGWLLCNGAAVSRTTYAGLYTAIGNAWGEGDGSTTFNVPDLRGRFLRGVDGAVGRDPDRASRTACATGGNTGDNVGSVQADAYKSHRHGYTQAAVSGPVWVLWAALGGSISRVCPKRAHSVKCAARGAIFWPRRVV